MISTLDPTLTSDPTWKGIVYDITGYDHPGGVEYLLQAAGTDGSALFKKQGHSPTAMDEVASRKKGILEGAQKKKAAPAAAKATDSGAVAKAAAPVIDPSDLEAFMSTTDLQNTAEAVLNSGAHAYYQAGAEDDQTTAENERVWSDFLLRPRCLCRV